MRRRPSTRSRSLIDARTARGSLRRSGPRRAPVPSVVASRTVAPGGTAGGAPRGAVAARVCRPRALGSPPGEDAFGPLGDFSVDSGLDGVLALGAAGEGILLDVDERRRVADLFLQAADNRLQVAVHCGAQTT